MERKDPDNTGDELTLLDQFLDFQRATMLLKVEGLTKAQLAQRIEPSTSGCGASTRPSRGPRSTGTPRPTGSSTPPSTTSRPT